MLTLLLLIASIFCAFQAVRVKQLLPAALWLTGVSALVATVLYLTGAHEVAVIELSVGAGLVTVLLVFAISIAGEDAMAAPSVVPRWLGWGGVLLAVVLLAAFILPVEEVERSGAGAPLAAVLWQERSLDVLVQVGLIFAAVLGVLGLLAEEKTPPQKRRAVHLRQVAGGNENGRQPPLHRPEIVAPEAADQLLLEEEFS